MTPKQKKEHSDFVAFSEVYFGNQIAFEHPSPPKPDILFILNNSMIGCELTTIYTDNLQGTNDSKLRRSESIQDCICNSLTDWLCNNIPVNIEIHIGFKNNINLHKSKKKSLMEKILAVIEKYISELNLSEFSSLILNHYKVLPEGLDYISLAYSPKLKRSIVTRAGGGCIPKLDDERIILNIKKKEKSLSKYVNLIDEKWLLLVIQDHLNSSEFDLLDGGYKNIESLFDKVFLFLRRDRKIVVLK